MAKPVGIAAKQKDNSNKKWREHNEWMAGKKIGRAKQKFNAETNSWEKVTA